MSQRAAARLALAAALVLPACGSGDPTLPEGISRSVIVFVVDPNPVLAAPSASFGFANIRYRVVVQEQGGLGGEFVFVNATVFDVPSGRSVAVNNFDGDDLIVFTGSKRLEGGQTVEIAQQIDFGLLQDSTGAELTVAVQFRDDRGNVLNQALLVPITFPTPSPSPSPS